MSYEFIIVRNSDKSIEAVKANRGKPIIENKYERLTME